MSATGSMTTATATGASTPSTARSSCVARARTGTGTEEGEAVDLLAEPALAEARILARSGGENFRVAMRWLPGGASHALLAIYGFARLVDEIGDSVGGDAGESATQSPDGVPTADAGRVELRRLALLDAVAAELRAAPERLPAHPVLRRFAEVARRHGLPPQLAERLIDANRREQSGPHRFERFEDLMASCEGTANPVGEMVLRVFDQADDRAIERSDRVCSALQIVEHCQDVREDADRGRVYLPALDLERFACDVASLRAAPAPPALRRVVALQVDRARDLLGAADELVARLRGPARVLVGGYAGGGLATCDALARGHFDVTSRLLRPRRRDVLRHTCALLLAARRRS